MSEVYLIDWLWIVFITSVFCVGVWYLEKWSRED